MHRSHLIEIDMRHWSWRSWYVVSWIGHAQTSGEAVVSRGIVDVPGAVVVVTAMGRAAVVAGVMEAVDVIGGGVVDVVVDVVVTRGLNHDVDVALGVVEEAEVVSWAVSAMM